MVAFDTGGAAGPAHCYESGATVAGESAGPGGNAGSCGFNPDKPSAARVYDYLLGGKDNFAADRDAAAKLLEALPDAALVAKANRAFLAAAVRSVASRGIDQFVDIGAGLPTSPNVHETARQAVPSARVAYVDNDPLVVTHARALLATDELVTVVNGDVHEYEAILSAPGLAALIDFARPVCVLFVSILHFLSADVADAAVAAFRERMAPGSYLVVSAGHGNDRSLPMQDRIQAAYGGDAVLTGRTAAEFATFFGDFELVPPGIVPITEWPLEAVEPAQSPPLRLAHAPTVAGMLAGIGRKRP
jgi:O-methyltransferase involved in polyketide biosynthesis